MRPLLVSVTVASMIAIASAQGPAVATGKDAFESGLKSVRETAARGKFQAARDQVTALLKAHESADYVFARQVEIAELVKKCVFSIQYPDPPPKSLISGELISWDQQTGAIKIKYTASKMKDWEGGDEKIHPIKFKGPWSIELKGASYPSVQGNPPAVVACLSEAAAVAVVFGCGAENVGPEQMWLPAKMVMVEGERKTVLDKKEHPPCRAGKPYTLKVRVTDAEVVAMHGGQVLLSGRRPKDYGQVVISGEAPDEIVLEGRAETSWILNLLDEARDKKRKEFERSFNLKRELPEWLTAAKVAAPAASPKKADPGFPDALSDEQGKVAASALAHLERHQLGPGIRLLEGLQPDALPEATRSFLLARFFEEADRLADAESMAEKAVQLAPKFWPADALRARILYETGRAGKAVEIYKVLLKAAPNDCDVAVDAARASLEAGRANEAKAIVDGAFARKLRSPALDVFNAVLVKALNGPPWAVKFEVKSQNFVVASDIDRKTCEDAAKILEDGFVAYTTWLERVPSASTEPFRVYLFSGEAGYSAWVKDLIGDVPLHTAGLYSPVLKVLLIWNLPSREDMLRTVRHEGFHQYLDRLVADAPSWFNEGLAEYFEGARLENGTWRAEDKNSSHLATLAENSTIPLDRFLFGAPREFYGNAELQYAQAWAFVTFLRHSSPENKQVFQKVWTGLRENLGADRALRQALSPPDVARLEREFAAWLRERR